MITLATLQKSTARNIAGYCPTDPAFIQLVNESVRRLMTRGDWIGTILPIRACVTQGCVTWPRQVAQVRKINECRNNIGVKTVWWDYQEHSNRRDYGHWSGWCGGERNMVNQFQACTYNDIYGPGCTVRIYCSLQDVGKKVTIFGIDNNGQPLQTINPDNTISQGITITAAMPFGTTSNTYFVSRIDRVVKEVTQANIQMFAYDTVKAQLWDLAVYEPTEENPSYQRYRLDGRWNMGVLNCGSNCLETVMALVKVRFISCVAPTDLIPIDNEGAIKLAMMSLKKEDEGDMATSRNLLERAIEELNRELEDSEPDSELVVNNNVFGRRTLFNQQF